MIILMMCREGGLLLFECCSIQMHPGKIIIIAQPVGRLQCTLYWWPIVRASAQKPQMKRMSKSRMPKTFVVALQAAVCRLWRVLVCVS